MWKNEDILRFWEIENDPEVTLHMPGKIKNIDEIKKWLEESTIYAIRDTQNQVIGFVQLYEVGETLAKRLGQKNLYEISFALPQKFRFRDGLVSEKVREVCAENKNEYTILAFVKPGHEKSIRVLERSGFVKVGNVKYHGNDKFENLVYKYVNIKR